MPHTNLQWYNSSTTLLFTSLTFFSIFSTFFFSFFWLGHCHYFFPYTDTRMTTTMSMCSWWIFTVSETCIPPRFSTPLPESDQAAVRWNQGLLLRVDIAVQLSVVSPECASPACGGRCQHRCKPVDAARRLWPCF